MFVLRARGLLLHMISSRVEVSNFISGHIPFLTPFLARCFCATYCKAPLLSTDSATEILQRLQRMRAVNSLVDTEKSGRTHIKKSNK